MEKHTTCVVCGDPLTTKRQTLYCSPKCGRKAWVARLPSDADALAKHRAYSAKWKRENQGHDAQSRECDWCGRTYETTSTTRFCSRACLCSSEGSASTLRWKVCDKCGRPYVKRGAKLPLCFACRTSPDLAAWQEARQAERARKNEKQRAPRVRDERARKVTHECVACGAEFELVRRAVKTTCGDPRCAVFNRTGEWPSRLVKRDMRSPLRIAIESGDAESAISILKQSTVTDANGCWTWTGRLGRDGYSRPSVGGRVVSGHRLMATLVYGDLKGSAVVHHKCANRQCINPDHLQPVSHRENVAEMLQRNYYLSRIEELERALECVDPLNSALKPSAA